MGSPSGTTGQTRTAISVQFMVSSGVPQQRLTGRSVDQISGGCRPSRPFPTARAYRHGGNPADIPDMALAPCHCLFQLLVQGASGHGGEVAGPIADRILERSLALDEGKFDMQVAWLQPAHHANPLQLIKSVSFNDKGGNLGSQDEENAPDSPTGTAGQMASPQTPIA